MESKVLLLEKLLCAANNAADNTAVDIAGCRITYSELWSVANAIAGVIDKLDVYSNLCGIFAGETFTTYQGILGVLLSGHGYVPLNPHFPAHRTTQMVQQAKINILITDQSGLTTLHDILENIEKKLIIILPESQKREVKSFKNSKGHEFITFDDSVVNPDLSIVDPRKFSQKELAYVIFTSGSTGSPKGVSISRESLVSFINNMNSLYGFNKNDRFSNIFDITFDASVLDIFIAFSCGATLCVIPKKLRMVPASYINQHKITVWFSVPTTIALMSELNILKPKCFPSIRYSFFCGEPLLASITKQWLEAANNSIVENLYGPTEFTVACMHYRCKLDTIISESESDIVPIGLPFPETEIALVNDAFDKVSEGQQGNLAICGSQIAKCYWENAGLTNKSFVNMPWDKHNRRWYLSGDLVKMERKNRAHFIGRLDHQIKISGFRVELGEVEHCLRVLGETQFAVIIPEYDSSGKICHLIGCIAQSNKSEVYLVDACRKELPAYMVPKYIFKMEKIPTNANGKIDRNEIMTLLKEGELGKY